MEPQGGWRQGGLNTLEFLGGVEIVGPPPLENDMYPLGKELFFFFAGRGSGL